jgi:hypothetical protein
MAERDVVMTAVQELIEAALSGHGTALFVIGEAGLGKTTVLEHAVVLASGRFRTAIGRADIAESRASVRADRTGAGAAARRPGQAAAGPGRADVPAVRRLLLRGAAAAPRSAATGPMLLALDDAHWSDPGSLTLLRLACRRIGSLPVALMVTARPWPPDALRYWPRRCGTTPAGELTPQEANATPGTTASWRAFRHD